MIFSKFFLLENCLSFLITLLPIGSMYQAPFTPPPESGFYGRSFEFFRVKIAETVREGRKKSLKNGGGGSFRKIIHTMSGGGGIFQGGRGQTKASIPRVCRSYPTTPWPFLIGLSEEFHCTIQRPKFVHLQTRFRGGAGRRGGVRITKEPLPTSSQNGERGKIC